jgi:hypothetical protein
LLAASVIWVAQAGQKADPGLAAVRILANVGLREGPPMSAAPTHKPIVHFVGSIPLPDAETVFRTLAAATGPYLKRLPDGETGIRKTWIRFLQQVLAENPAIEVASDAPPFKFTPVGRQVIARNSTSAREARRAA